MEPSLPFIHTVQLVCLALLGLILPVYCQFSIPCSPSLIASFTPCFNFLTNSTADGTSPTSDCCNSIKNIASASMDCACQMLTGSVPFELPINKTLAISLPSACDMAGVPLQCKAAVAPVAPGPVSLGPTLSPGVSPSDSPSTSVAPEPTPSAQPPESDATPAFTQPSSTEGNGVPPTSSTGIRPVLTPPSLASASCSFSPSLVLLALGFVLLKYY